MIRIVRVAPLHRSERGFRQLRFQRHHRLGFRVHRSGIVSSQRQHLGDVRNVGIAQFHRLVVGLRVVVAIRQSQAALSGAPDYFGAVLKVLLRSEPEPAAHPFHLQVGDLRLEFFGILDRGDSLELRLQRLQPGALNRVAIHATGVEVADLLFGAAGFRALILCRHLQYLVQYVFVVRTQHVEIAPACVRRRNWIRFYPAAAGKMEEVVARLHRAVQIGEVKTVCRGRIYGRGSLQRGASAGHVRHRSNRRLRFRAGLRRKASRHCEYHQN